MYLSQRGIISQMCHVVNRQVVTECVELLWQVNPTPLPSPLPKPVSLWPSESTYTVHAVFPPTQCAGEGHWGCQPKGSSCLDALALLPNSLTTPQSLLPFYSLLRFQFRWWLIVASVVFIYFDPRVSMFWFLKKKKKKFLCESNSAWRALTVSGQFSWRTRKW